MATSKKSKLPLPISLIEYKDYGLLVFDAPTDENLAQYISVLTSHNVRNVVRACDPTYSTEPLRTSNIAVHEMPFPDGGVPSRDLIDKWLSLLRNTFTLVTKEVIGIHCIAGLGRAPLLVALALMEAGMTSSEAVQYVRERRKGSINMKQMQWLALYKPRKRKSCIVM